MSKQAQGASAPVPFAWGEITLSEVLHVDGVPHATKTAIGEWLEYADPRDGINKVLERNSYIEEYSVAVKLTATDGKKYESSVYHPMGFLLIVMESGQPKALVAKIAIAAFVWHFCGGRNVPSLPVRDIMAMEKRVADLHEKIEGCQNERLVKVYANSLRSYYGMLNRPMPVLPELAQQALEGF